MDPGRLHYIYTRSGGESRLFSEPSGRQSKIEKLIRTVKFPQVTLIEHFKYFSQLYNYCNGAVNVFAEATQVYLWIRP